MPCVISAPPACCLLFGNEYASFSRPGRSRLHRGNIGRADLKKMMQMRTEHGSLQQWIQCFGQEEVSNFRKTIAGCRVAFHFHAQCTQLLNQSPNL